MYLFVSVYLKTVLIEVPSFPSDGGETVSFLCGFGGYPLQTHPKRHELFSSTHQLLRKDNNSDYRILSLERGTKRSNLNGCNQVILKANKCC